jgi:DNA repair exonuclease SbcCD ATPase subunit
MPLPLCGVQDVVRQKGSLESRCSSLKGTAEDLTRRDLWHRKLEQTLEQRKKQTIDQLAEENCALQAHIAECDKKLADTTKQLEACMQQLTETETERDSLHTKLTTSEAVCLSMTEQISQCQTTVQFLGEVDVKLQQLTIEHEHLLQRNIQLEASIQSIQQQRQSEALAMAESQASAIQAEREAHAAKQQQLEQCLAEATKASASAAARAHNLENLLASTTTRLNEELAYERNKHDAEMKIVMTQLDEEASQLSELRAELAKETQVHSRVLTDIHAQREQDRQDQAHQLESLQQLLHHAEAICSDAKQQVVFTAVSHVAIQHIVYHRKHIPH